MPTQAHGSRSDLAPDLAAAKVINVDYRTLKPGDLTINFGDTVHFYWGWVGR